MHYFMEHEATTENIVKFLNIFKCQRCKKSCCQRLDPNDGIALKRGETATLASNLGISHSQFKDRYTFVKDGNRFMVAPCPFYSEEVKGCSIHRFRPQVCRQFPFNKSIEIKGVNYMTVNVDCPSGKIIGEKYGVIPETVGVEE